MSVGFGEERAARSLEKSSRELKALRRVIEKYKDDPKGRIKMMKKMKKYWRSNLSIVDGMDHKPQTTEDFGGGFVPVGMVDDLEWIKKTMGVDVDSEERGEEYEESLTDEQISGVRDMIIKSKQPIGEDDQPTPEV